MIVEVFLVLKEFETVTQSRAETWPWIFFGRRRETSS